MATKFDEHFRFAPWLSRRSQADREHPFCNRHVPFVVSRLLAVVACSILPLSQGWEARSAEPGTQVPRYEFKQSGITEWLLLGPVHRSDCPESPAVSFGEPREGQLVEFESGISLAWTRWKTDSPDGLVDLQQFVGQQDLTHSAPDSVVYAFCLARYNRPAKLQITAGMSGISRVWVDDRLVVEDLHQGPFDLSHHRLAIDFTRQRQHGLLLEIGKGFRLRQFACRGGFAIRGRAQFPDHATPVSMGRISLHVNGRPTRSVTTDESGRFLFEAVPYNAELRLEANGLTLPTIRFDPQVATIDPQIGQFMPMFVTFVPSGSPGIESTRLELPFGSFTGIAEQPDGRIFLFEEVRRTIMVWDGTALLPHPNPHLRAFTDGQRGHLALDSQGALWVITDADGVYRVEGDQKEHWPADQLGFQFQAFYVDSEDVLWASFLDQPGHVFRLLPGSPQPEKIQIERLANGRIAAMTRTEEGVALLPEEGPMLLRAPDGAIHCLGVIENARFSSALTLADGTVLLAGSHLFEFKEDEDLISNWNNRDSDSRNQFIGVAPDGTRWAWSGAGVYHYVPNGPRQYRQLTQVSASVAESRFQGLVSMTGALFRTLGTDGVVRFAQERVRKFNHRDGIQNETGVSVSAGNGFIAVNSHDKDPLLISKQRLSLLRNTPFDISRVGQSFPRDVVTLAWGANNELFAFDHLSDGSGDATATGCPPLRHSKGKWLTVPGALSQTHYCAYHFCEEGLHGETLIGTSDGLITVRASRSEWSHYFESERNPNVRKAINTLWIDPNGTVWGTEERGPLYCRKGDTLQRYDFETRDVPWSTQIAMYDGILHVSTLQGLFYLDEPSGRLKRSEVERFSQVPIVGMQTVKKAIWNKGGALDERRSCLCLATRSNGIYLMDTEGIVVYLNGEFELDDFMATNLFIDSLERIWVSSERGTYCYFPSGIRPTLILGSVTDAHGIADEEPGYRFEIEQSASFHMSGRDDSSNLQFQYRLNKDAWVTFSDGQVAASLDLPLLEKGAHRIEFRCIDSDLHASKPVALAFEVYEPIWRTSAFRNSAIVLVIALIGTIAYSWSSSQKARAEKARLQEAVLREATEARQIAEDATNEREMLLARVCHDLRNPLTVVQASVDLLQSPGPDLETITTLLVDSSTSMSHLTDQLLMYAKSRRANAKHSETIIDVKDTLKQLANVNSIRVRNSEVAFEVQMAENCPRVIRFDRGIMLEIINNLIDNAIRHTASGSIKVHCRMANPMDFVIDVIDTGPGISPEIKADIFKPFRAGSKPGTDLSRAFHGNAGLGLYISKQLVEQLGGTIELQTELNKGTAITVHLGNVVADPSRERDDDPLRLLIMDDDPTILAAMANLFATRGYDVMSTDDQFNMESLELLRPDVAFVDLVLPVPPGFVVAHMFRRKFGDSLRIIGMSAAKPLLQRAANDENFDSTYEKSQILSKEFVLDEMKPARATATQAGVRVGPR